MSADLRIDELRQIGAGLRELQVRVAAAIDAYDKAEAERRLARIAEILERVEKVADKNQTGPAAAITGDQIAEIFAIACGRIRTDWSSRT